MTSFPSDFSSQPCEKKKTSIHETQIASPEDLAFAKSSTPTPIHKSLEDLEEPNPPSPPFLTREASSEEVAYIKSFTPPPEASSPFLTREASSEEVAYIKSFTPPPDSPQWSNKTLTFPKEELEGESYADDPYKTSALELQDSSLAPKVERTLDIPVEEFDRLMTPPPTVPAPFVHGETNSHTPSKLPSPSTPAPKGSFTPAPKGSFTPAPKGSFTPAPKDPSYFSEVRNYQYAYGTTKPQTDQIPQNQEGTMTDISAKSFVSLNPRVGDMISEYKVIKKLGEGGMGTVYKCLDPLLKRHVALKLLKREFSQKESFRIRFEIEAQAVAQLRHPNIIQVFRAGEDPVRHNLFFAMDFIEGRPLDEVLRGNLAPEKALRYIQQVAEGLAYSHKKQILHRDIKPENIMISKDDCALIMDFGIAKVIGESPEEILEAHQSEEIGVSDLKLTQHGSLVGTPMYIAPERIHGVNDDPRSDIYALGMVLYYCITGKPPFAEDTVLRILQAQKSKEPQAIEELVPTCPPALIQIFKKMTAKRLEDRFSSMGVLLQSIEEYFRAKENAVITAQQLQEKKQIYKEIALTQLSKEKKSAKGSSFWTKPFLLLGIGIALTLLFSFLYQQSFFDLKTSPQEEWFLKTRKLDEIWVSGELTRIAGSFIHKTSLADKRIMVTLNSTFLEEVNTIQQIVFSPESWEFLQKLYHPLFQEGSYLAFQGKAILNQEELGAYLEGDAHSLLPLPLLKLRNPQTQEELRFSQERDRETLLVEGAILLIQENENKDLDLLLSNAGGESQVWIRIREKTLKKVEAEKFSPRLGDLVYATGILEVEEEEGSFQYTLDVDPEQMQHTFSSALH